jgi:hypothetical protein
VSEAIESWAFRVGRRLADEQRRHRSKPGGTSQDLLEREIRRSPLLTVYAAAARKGYHERLGEMDRAG